MIDENLFANLRRSPFDGGMDVSSVVEQYDSIPSVPTSAIEDIGFTPEQLALIRDGLYNADFLTPPPEPDEEIDDLTNKLPGWSLSLDGDGVSVKWNDGSIEFTTDGSGDEATLEQIVPISRVGTTRVSHPVSMDVTMTAGSNQVFLSAQYLDEDYVVTGTEDSEVDSWADFAYPQGLVTVLPNGEAGAPDDARFLRVRIRATALGTDTEVLNHVIVERRLTLGGVPNWNNLLSNAGGLTTLRRTQLLVLNDLDGANRTIHGINSVGVKTGRLGWIYNMDSTHSVILAHESGSANDSAYRIQCPNNADLTIRPRGGVLLCYFGDDDGTAMRWRVLSQV